MSWQISPGCKRRKYRVIAFETNGRRLAIENQQAIPERHRCAGLERDVERRLLAFAERLLPDGIRREEAVAARMPVRGEPEVVRVIENRDRHGFGPDLSGQHRPL